jgi:hypothetical protein
MITTLTHLQFSDTSQPAMPLTSELLHHHDDPNRFPCPEHIESPRTFPSGETDFDDECSTFSFHLFVDNEHDKWNGTTGKSLKTKMKLESDVDEYTVASSSGSLHKCIHVVTMLCESLSDLVFSLADGEPLACPSRIDSVEHEKEIRQLRQDLADLLSEWRQDVKEHVDSTDIPFLDDGLSHKVRRLLEQNDQINMLSKVLSEIKDLEIMEKSKRDELLKKKLESSLALHKSSSVHKTLLASLHSDVSSITSWASSSYPEFCCSANESGTLSQSTDNIFRELKSQSTHSHNSMKKRHGSTKSRVSKSRPQMQLACDLDSALQDSLTSPCPLLSEDKIPTRPQRRCSFADDLRASICSFKTDEEGAAKESPASPCRDATLRDERFTMPRRQPSFEA